LITSEHSLSRDLPDLQATDAFASDLAKSLLPGLIIFLHGDLGAGKTTLVRSMLFALGHTGSAKSPTYTLVEPYQINALTINHFDLYRLADPSELEYIGIRDYVNAHSICIFEWADKGIGYVPPADIEITLQFTANGRKAVLVAKTAIGQAILKELKQ
jgi:tRNA threonylcarbamoyladenosine biosynthesis protein TsaE